VQEDDPRVLVGHVVVDRDDVDAAGAQRLQHRLQLGLQHREVAVDDALSSLPRERRPGVDAHRLPTVWPPIFWSCGR
jgi:hypothetical protein